jgi:hypothetical protein
MGTKTNAHEKPMKDRALDRCQVFMGIVKGSRLFSME